MLHCGCYDVRQRQGEAEGDARGGMRRQTEIKKQGRGWEDMWEREERETKLR